MRNDDRFRFTLLAWFRKNGRDLPWRQTRDPYAILVSEFMLQQTQVATVLPYYERWLRRFPDFPTLAKATESQVLHAWQGLGYYARVRNLHASAKTVTRKFGSKLPANLELMSALPGIGKYTAGAVATFAFNRPVPIVEANIARVLARLTNLQTPIDSSDGRNELWRRASALIPTRGARDYNSALIDLGALVCLPRTRSKSTPDQKPQTRHGAFYSDSWFRYAARSRFARKIARSLGGYVDSSASRKSASKKFSPNRNFSIHPSSDHARGLLSISAATGEARSALVFCSRSGSDSSTIAASASPR